MKRVFKAGSSIQSGVISDITGLLSKLDGMLDKVFKNLDSNNEAGIRIDSKSKRDVSGPDGDGLEYDLYIYDDKLGTYTVIPKDKDTSSLIFKVKGYSPERVDGVKNSDIERASLDWGLKFINKTKYAKSGKVLNVTLQRVTSGKRDEIRLTAIKATYNIKAALGSLDAVLEDEELLDMITEEPVSFEITDCEDGGFLDVEPCEPFDCTNEVETLLSAAATFSNNMLMLHWSVKGLNFMELHRTVEDWYHTSRWDMDMLGELAVELCNSAPNPGAIINTDDLLPSRSEYTEAEAYQIANDQIGTYVTALETYYVNFAHDVQSSLDNMIRYWRKEQHYKIARALRG